LNLKDIKTGTSERTLTGHTDIVNDVCCTPDGKIAVSASDDATLRVWNLQTGECMKTLRGHTSLVRGVCCNFDGTIVVSASDDATLRVWNLQTGECMKTLRGHTSGVNSVCCSSSGNVVVSASRDKTLRVWELKTGKLKKALVGHIGSVESVCCTPDGRIGVSASYDKSLRVWDLETGECKRVLTGHNSRVSSVRCSADGRIAVSADEDSTLKIWDMETGECTQTCTNQNGTVKSVYCIDDGRLAISSSNDNDLQVWNIKTGKLIKRLVGHTDSVESVCCTPDGKLIISASHDKTLRVWDLEIRRNNSKEAISLSNLADEYLSENRYDEAIVLYKKALELDESTLGSNHPNVVTILSKLAELYKILGKYQDALPLYQRALRINEIALGPNQTKTESNHFSPQEVETISVGEHERWVSGQMIEGWVYGEKRDTANKVSSHLVPWSNLPDEAKECFRQAVRKMPVFLAKTKLEIYTRMHQNRTAENAYFTPNEKESILASQNKTLPIWEIGTDESKKINENLSSKASPVSENSRENLTAEIPGNIFDNVHFSVISPSQVCQGASFVVDIWAHLGEQREEVIRRAKEALPKVEISVKSKGPINVSRGTILTIRLKIDELVVENCEDTLMWKNEIGNTNYRVTVPKETVLGSKAGMATVHANVLITRIYFNIQVGNKTFRSKKIQTKQEEILTAFASYASADRDYVLACIQGIQKFAPKLHVDMDVVTLRSGQYWEKELWKMIPSKDIFYLFWSSNAAKSGWVEKEWRCALKTRGLDFIDPVSLETPEQAPPPPELSSKHFNDWTTSFMRGRRQ
jgi:WD40 repeat protein